MREDSQPRSPRVLQAPLPHPPMYLLARRETSSFHANTCPLSSKSVKCPEGLPISSKPATREALCPAAHLPCSPMPPGPAPPCPHQGQPRGAASQDPEGPGGGRAPCGQGPATLTREELVLPEKVQVPVQVSEVVAQALPSRPAVKGTRNVRAGAGSRGRNRGHVHAGGESTGARRTQLQTHGPLPSCGSLSLTA